MEEKVSLPTKTKIAAWWMIVIGGIALIVSTWACYEVVILGGGEPESTATLLFMVIIPLVPIGIGFFFPGTMILYLKIKLGWWLAVTSLFIGTIVVAILDISYVINNLGSLFSEGLMIFNLVTILITLIVVIPFILLLLDRKNFFKIAS